MPKKTSSKNLVHRDKDCQNLLTELKSILAQGQYQAYKAVDNIRVQTYWQLGERIVREELKHQDRADYGKYLIENLTVDLELSLGLLYDIVKFNKTYKIFHAVRGELSWTHYRQLIYIDNPEERSFYEHQTILHSWSSRGLKKQVKAQLYKNTPKKEIQAVFQTSLPAVQPQEVFKDTYDFNFIEIQADPNEKELEDKILSVCYRLFPLIEVHHKRHNSPWRQNHKPSNTNT